MAAVKAATNTSDFTYITAVTRLKNPGERHQWEQHQAFRGQIGGNPIKILTLEEILGELWPELTHTPAPSDRVVSISRPCSFAYRWDNSV